MVAPSVFMALQAALALTPEMLKRTIAASTPRIVITTRSSTSVKPPWVCRERLRACETILVSMCRSVPPWSIASLGSQSCGGGNGCGQRSSSCVTARAIPNSASAAASPPSTIGRRDRRTAAGGLKSTATATFDGPGRRLQEANAGHVEVPGEVGRPLADHLRLAYLVGEAGAASLDRLRHHAEQAGQVQRGGGAHRQLGVGRTAELEQRFNRQGELFQVGGE